ncbi:MAG: hypothetical protein WA787_13440, partial [Azonexus sp.]
MGVAEPAGGAFADSIGGAPFPSPHPAHSDRASVRAIHEAHGLGSLFAGRSGTQAPRRAHYA